MGIKNKSQPVATPEQLVEAAKECPNAREFEAGIECYKALQIDKHYEAAHFGRMRDALYNMANDFDSSAKDRNKSRENHGLETLIERCNMALKFDPDDILLIHQRAGAYYYLDDYDNAMKDNERLTILAPEEPSPYYNLGVCYRIKKDLAKAVAYFNKTVELGNRQSHVYKSRGLAYMYMGEYDKAIADLSLAGEEFLPSLCAELKTQDARRELNIRRKFTEESYIKKSQEKILDTDTIIDREELLLEQCEANNEQYSEYLIHKFADFAEDEAVLNAYIRGVVKDFDLVAKYILLEFVGLIVSCFELPPFKIKKPGYDKDDEMLKYIEKLFCKNYSMVSELKKASFFADDRIKKECEYRIDENNLRTEVKEEYDDVSAILARYPSSQPCLREYIASLVSKSQQFLMFHFHLIIEFLWEYYFE